MRKQRTAWVGVAAAAMIAGTAWADELRIGTAVETTSIDPLYYNFPPNLQIAQQLFDYLITKDHRLQLQPGLAVSWKSIDDTTWEFKLRKGVKFHDGTPFTPDDVVFTFDHAPKVPGSGSIPGRFAKGKTVKVIDDQTIHVSTAKPHALMPYDLSAFAIVSRKHGEGAKTEDYNTGKATIGTGVYKFVEWKSGDRLVMAANPDYWGKKAKWEQVVYKPIKSGPTRIAALLNGDVDMIDFVPPADIARLEKDPKVTVNKTASNRIIYLQCDSSRDISPQITTNDGKPMFPNPCRDWRVRKAMSMAINREAIVERVMEGAAVAAGQVFPEGLQGYNPEMKVEPYDLEGAKKLLAKVGYGDGFRISLHSPNDRYVNDAKIAETVAQMFARLGIQTRVMAMPKSVYFNKCKWGGERRTSACSLMLLGYGSDTGEAGATLNNTMHTMMPAAAMGNSNRGRYSNDRYDQIIQEAFKTIDIGKREKLFQLANKVGVDDLGIIPLHHQVNIWALRKGLVYETRTDEYTMAQGVSKVK